jgi:hypothetical protein
MDDQDDNNFRGLRGNIMGMREFCYFDLVSKTSETPEIIAVCIYRRESTFLFPSPVCSACRRARRTP